MTDPKLCWYCQKRKKKKNSLFCAKCEKIKIKKVPRAEQENFYAKV